MAKARSRAAARKIKDKWKAKSWYNVLAPASFDHVTIAETLADDPGKLIGRVTEVSLQDLTNDFRKSHIKLYFRIKSVEDNKAHTEYIGHTLTSDYLRRMIRRKRSKIDAVYDIKTRDGAIVRIKPFATTDRRIQNSQKRVIRETMKKTIIKQAKASPLSEFIKYILDGKIGVDIYKNCKTLYPIKRVEIYKTEVFTQPTIQMEEPKKQPTDVELGEPAPVEEPAPTSEEEQSTEQEKSSAQPQEKEPVEKEKSSAEATEDAEVTEETTEEESLDTPETPAVESDDEKEP